MDIKTLVLLHISRKQRIPYSKHERTLLYTVPIADSISYDELLQQVRRNRPKPIPIDKESYIPDETFHKNMINLNAKITEEMMKSEMKQQELQKRKRELLSAKRKNLNKDSVDLDFSSIDMRSLVSKILGSPEKEYSNYSMFKCPFHACFFLLIIKYYKMKNNHKMKKPIILYK